MSGPAELGVKCKYLHTQILSGIWAKPVHQKTLPYFEHHQIFRPSSGTASSASWYVRKYVFINMHETHPNASFSNKAYFNVYFMYVKVSIIDMKNNSNFTCLNKKFAENCGWFDEDILQQVVMNELLVTGLKPVLDTTENLRFSWLELIECIWGDINLADFEQDRYLDSLLLTRYVLNISLITFPGGSAPSNSPHNNYVQCMYYVLNSLFAPCTCQFQ